MVNVGKYMDPTRVKLGNPLILTKSLVVPQTAENPFKFGVFLNVTHLTFLRNPKEPPGMVLKPCKWWAKLPTSTGERWISEPSTVYTYMNE